MKRVVFSLLVLLVPAVIDLAVAWGFGNFAAGRSGGASLAGVVLATSINLAATWLCLLSIAYLVGQAIFLRRHAGLRRAAGGLLFFAVLVFLAYLSFAWGFIVFNGFSPSWDAVWFLLRNAAHLPQHLLQTSFVLSLVLIFAFVALPGVVLLCLGRLVRAEPRHRGRRLALAGLALGLVGALTTAAETTANVSAVGFTALTLDKVVRAGRSQAQSLDAAAVLQPMRPYRGGDPKRLHDGPAIVIMVESLRRDLLQMTPSPVPFLKSLARDSLQFDKAYATASHSNYADLAFWYSRYPLHNLDFFWSGFPRDAPWRGESLFSAAKKNHFATAYVSSQDENWGQMINWLDVKGEVDFFFHAPDYEDYRWHDPSDRPAVEGPGIATAGKLEDSATLAVALDWIRSLGDKRHFLLGLNLQNTHFSYILPPGAKTPYQPSDLGLDAVYYKWPESEKVQIRNRYLNAAWNVDRLLAGFVAALKHEGLWDDCVFVVVGDSGEAFYEHGFGNHSGPMYDEVMRTLALLKPPRGSGLSPGVYQPAISHIDFAPTVLDLLGMAVPDSFQGRSLLDPPRRRLFMHTNAAVKQHGLVEWPWKLLHTYYPYERFELYQLERDPQERHDLIRAKADKAAELRRTLDAWIEQQLGYYADPAIYEHYAPPKDLAGTAPAAAGG